MAKTFECPSCGAAQEYHGGPETSIKCPYCGTTVVVPEELRPAAPPTPQPADQEGLVIRIRPPEDGATRPEITFNVPQNAQMQRMEQLLMQQQTRRVVRRGAAGCGGCGCLGAFLFVALFVGGMIYIFGLSIKTNPMYTCAVAAAQQNSAVVQALGTPITPAFFAWISSFKSSGDLESGFFSTDLSGPKGSGSLRVSGTRDSSGLSLTATFVQNGRTISVQNGRTQCR